MHHGFAALEGPTNLKIKECATITSDRMCSKDTQGSKTRDGTFAASSMIAESVGITGCKLKGYGFNFLRLKLIHSPWTSVRLRNEDHFGCLPDFRSNQSKVEQNTMRRYAPQNDAAASKADVAKQSEAMQCKAPQSKSNLLL